MVEKIVLKQGTALVDPLDIRQVFACRWFVLTISHSLVTRCFPSGPYAAIWLYSVRTGFVLRHSLVGCWAVYHETDLARMTTYGRWL